MIIFDLDDTLIDTSGSITPFKLRECLKFFIKEGLVVGDFEKAYEELLECNELFSNSKEALKCFLLKMGGSENLFEMAKKIMAEPLPSDFFVPCTPNAKEILHYLSQFHQLMLVTAGYPPFQLEKLEKAGIDRSIFSKILVSEDSHKGPLFQDLMEEFSEDPKRVFVCGDRIKVDLTPARMLGLKTIHMRWGRGIKEKSENWIDYKISDLSELKGIIKI